VIRNDTLHDSVLNADTMATACDRSRGGRNAALGYLEAWESPDACEQEELVVDDRASVRPAQALESKLMTILQAASLPVSHLRMRGLLVPRHGEEAWNSLGRARLRPSLGIPGPWLSRPGRSRANRGNSASLLLGLVIGVGFVRRDHGTVT